VSGSSYIRPGGYRDKVSKLLCSFAMLLSGVLPSDPPRKNDQVLKDGLVGEGIQIVIESSRPPIMLSPRYRGMPMNGQ
jgi:hypothetical protein